MCFEEGPISKALLFIDSEHDLFFLFFLLQNVHLQRHAFSCGSEQSPGSKAWFFISVEQGPGSKGLFFWGVSKGPPGSKASFFLVVEQRPGSKALLFICFDDVPGSNVLFFTGFEQGSELKCNGSHRCWARSQFESFVFIWFELRPGGKG